MPSLSAEAVDDAPVGLMRHEPVDVAGRRAGVSEASVDYVGHHADGVAEHFLALHPQMAGGLSGGRARRRHKAWRDAGRRSEAERRSRRGRAMAPSPSCASSTMAPAPSPNSTQVVRSFQSRMREKVSAPITSALLCEPERRNLSAVAVAKTNPLHTACRSKATPWVMPRLAWTWVAVDGKV